MCRGGAEVKAQLCVCLAAGFSILQTQLLAQNRPVPATLPVSTASAKLNGQLRAHDSLPGGCPNYNGPLEAISEPVGQSDEFVVLSGAAPEGGITWNVYSSDPSIVAAGDANQGFIPQVFTAEGQSYSTPFTLFGVSVGQTSLIIQETSPGSSSGSTPLGAWAVGGSGGTTYLDANAIYNSCRINGDSPLFLDPANAADQLANCGSPVVGTVTDGVSTILLQTTSGLAGTACYQITSSSDLDQGTLQTTVTPTYSSGEFQSGFSFYTAPASYGDN
jgi:hypothetical protein